jgi:hypothetical protein
LFRDDYRLREKVSTRARNIRIEVRPWREVVLVYPRWVARAEALAFLQSRDAWVRGKLAEFDAREADHPLPPPARWDGTDEILWRGTLVPVFIEPATLRQVQVRIEPERVTVFAPVQVRDHSHKLEQALKRELMRHAGVEARRVLDLEAGRLGVTWTGLAVADPQTQWGSCASDGTVSLSWRLVMAPPAVLRYVSVHELCHRLHMDHSPRFWRLVARQLPGYAEQKAWLRDHGQRLHHYLPKLRPRG